MKSSILYLMYIDRSRGGEGLTQRRHLLGRLLVYYDLRRQEEGGGVKNPILGETSFMDVPLV